MSDIIDSETILEIILYAEDAERTIDGELGASRSIDKIIQSNDMPAFYYKLLKAAGTTVEERIKFHRTRYTL